MPFVFSHVEYCDMHFVYVFAMVIRELLLKNIKDVSPIEEFRLGVYLLEFTRHCWTMVVFQVFQ